jgi:hypothetical protein
MGLGFFPTLSTNPTSIKHMSLTTLKNGFVRLNEAILANPGIRIYPITY